MITMGIDLTEISRIEQIVKKNPRFIARVFSGNEQVFFEKKGIHKYESMAAAFAAKEAFGKALGTGIKGFSLNEVEVLHGKLGEPYLNLLCSAEKIAEQRGLSFSLSITHTKDIAAAVVVGYK